MYGALFGYPEDPCSDCWDGECTMNCSPVVKRLSKSGSYPYMAAANAFGVSYVAVLHAADDITYCAAMSQITGADHLPDSGPATEAAHRASIEERRRRERAK